MLFFVSQEKKYHFMDQELSKLSLMIYLVKGWGNLTESCWLVVGRLLLYRKLELQESMLDNLIWHNYLPKKTISISFFTNVKIFFLVIKLPKWPFLPSSFTLTFPILLGWRDLRFLPKRKRSSFSETIIHKFTDSYVSD